MHAERFFLKKWSWKIKKMRTISCKFTDVLIKYIAVIPALQSRAVSPGGGGAKKCAIMNFFISLRRN